MLRNGSQGSRRFAPIAAGCSGTGGRVLSEWVAEVIEKCGHQVYVSNTRKVPYISESDAKDDPGDAYKLAELVHFKPRLLHPIEHRSEALQADLSWIRARERRRRRGRGNCFTRRTSAPLSRVGRPLAARCGER